MLLISGVRDRCTVCETHVQGNSQSEMRSSEIGEESQIDRDKQDARICPGRTRGCSCT